MKTLLHWAMVSFLWLVSQWVAADQPAGFQKLAILDVMTIGHQPN